MISRYLIEHITRFLEHLPALDGGSEACCAFGMFHAFSPGQPLPHTWMEVDDMQKALYFQQQEDSTSDLMLLQ